MHDPRLESLLELASRSHGQLGQRARAILLQQTVAQAMPALASPWGSAGLAAGPYFLGHLPDGLPLSIGPADLNGPVTLVVGPPQAGKSLLLERLATTAAAQGTLAVVFDTKSRPDAPFRHPLPVLTPAQAALSLSPPAGCDPGAFLRRVLTILEQTCFVHSGSLLIEEAAVALRARGEVCLAGVLDELALRADRAKTWKSSAHYESAINALKRVCSGHAMFSGVRPLPWERRFAHGHAVALAGLSAEAQRIAVLTYLEALLLHARAWGAQDRALRCLVVLDDARVVAKGVRREGQASMDALVDFADKAHASGIGVVIALQHLGEVSSDLLAGANGLILVGPIAAEDLNRLRGRLQLGSERAEYLLRQPPFQAVVHFRRSPFPHPLPVALAGPEHALSVEEAASWRARGMGRLLEGITVEVYAGRSEPIEDDPLAKTSQPAGLEPKLHALLVALSQRPWLTQSELGEACGVQGRELTALRDDLVQLGHVRVHRLLRYALWELTEPGSRSIGIAHVVLAGRGAFPHCWLQARWAAWMRRDHPRVEVEFQVPGVGLVDGYAEGADGKRSVVEVVLSEETLDRAIEKLAAMDAERLLVVRDGTAKRRAVARLAGLAGAEVVTVQEFVKDSSVSSS